MKPVRFAPLTQPHRRFLQSLRERVRMHLEQHPKVLDGRLSLWLRSAFWAGVSLCLYGWLLSRDQPKWQHLPVVGLLGCSTLLLGFAVGHDASHGVVGRVPILDKLIHLASFIGIGIDPTLWRIRHIQSHHRYPNVADGDTDAAENPLLRLSPHQRWRPWFRWQAFYAPLVYAIVVPYAVVIADQIRVVAEWRNRSREAGASKWRLLSAFMAGKVCHFSFVFAIPVLVAQVPFVAAVTAYAFYTVCASLLFSLMLVGTHFAEETAHPVADASGVLPVDWAIHNLLTACDWNPESRLAGFISGGANTHVAHHLFPNMTHVFYHEITPIIRQTAEEHGLPYHSLSLSRMMLSHFRFLHRMGQCHGTHALEPRTEGQLAL